MTKVIETPSQIHPSMNCVLIEASSASECLAKIEELKLGFKTTEFTAPAKTGDNSYVSFGRLLAR